MIRLYDKMNAMFKNKEGWLGKISYSMEVNQVFPLSPTFFGIYTKKLEAFLCETSCTPSNLVGIVTILFFYTNDISNL